MSKENRYYWLKLQEDFFSSVRIKKLRKIAGGDTYTIIYLKMQLLSIRNGGILKYSGYESSFEEELAIDLDEEPENVSITLQYLLSCGLIETSDNIDYLLPFAAVNIGSEGSGAKRVREFRERKKMLHGNDGVTLAKQIGNGEKDIERDIEKEYISSSNEEDCPTPNGEDEPKKKKGRKKAEPIPHDHKAYKSALWLYRRIKERMPKVKNNTEEDFQRWAKDIDKINRIDGYAWEDISDVLVFSQKDSFWQTNVLSGGALRKNFVKLMAQEAKQTDD